MSYRTGIGCYGAAPIWGDVSCHVLSCFLLSDFQGAETQRARADEHVVSGDAGRRLWLGVTLNAAA